MEILKLLQYKLAKIVLLLLVIIIIKLIRHFNKTV